MFLGEYTARSGYAYSQTNNIIHNFKMGVEIRGNAQRWRYKERDIRVVAEAFSKAIHSAWLATATLVPIPPSKLKSDPLYDDRVLRMLRLIPAEGALDVRELIVQTIDRPAAHGAQCRPNPDELLQCYEINEAVARPEPSEIGVFDDVLVTGAGYKACQALLQHRFPDAEIYGFFIARRAPEASDPDLEFDIF